MVLNLDHINNNKKYNIMKTINRIVTCLMLVVSIGLQANNINSGTKEELINKMSEDNNVINFFDNSMKLTVYGKFAKQMQEKLSKEEINNENERFSKILEVRNISLNKIYIDYPELNTLSITERKDIFKELFNTKRTAARVSLFFSCLGTSCAALPTCIFAGISAYKKWAFSACFALAVASSLAAQAADPVVLLGVIDSPLELDLVKAEGEACAKCVHFSTEGTAEKITECVFFLFGAISSCVATYIAP